jgi:hypothetical protein
LRIGAGLTALLTAGENGEAIDSVLGDCATMPSTRIADVEPGVTARPLTEFPRSNFGGVSKRRSTVLGVRPVVDFGDCSAGVIDGHGGAGGSVGGSEV